MNVAFQLEKAAPILAGLKQPIVVAKVDADKYKKLASKHDVGYVAMASWHDNFGTCLVFITFF